MLQIFLICWLVFTGKPHSVHNVVKWLKKARYVLDDHHKRFSPSCPLQGIG